jgi:hypothetical protein
MGKKRKRKKKRENTNEDEKKIIIKKVNVTKRIVQQSQPTPPGVCNNAHSCNTKIYNYLPHV